MTIDAEEKLLDRVTAIVHTLDFGCPDDKQKGEFSNTEPPPQNMVRLILIFTFFQLDYLNIFAAFPISLSKVT